MPSKKFDITNTNPSTGKAGSGKAASKAAPPSTVHPKNAPPQVKPKSPVTGSGTNAIRENRTALGKRSKQAGV